jgi:D-alanine transaminase
MSRVAYVNGRYVPFADAAVHIEDRGYQFADGVYEVMAVRNRRLADLEPHLDRLDRSLAELFMDTSMSRRALSVVLEEVVRRNRVIDGIIYLQMTRGVAKRDHAFPEQSKTSLVVTARSMPPRPAAILEKGVNVITVPDIRWQRCDIKSVSLLPNILAKQAAREAGAYEAWMVDKENQITEGSSTNAWIVDDSGDLITRQLDNAILSGITRMVVRDLAMRQQRRLVERSFTLKEAEQAAEAFLTSTTSFVTPVVQINDTPIGGGVPGPVTRALYDLYEAHLSGQSTD